MVLWAELGSTILLLRGAKPVQARVRELSRIQNLGGTRAWGPCGPAAVRVECFLKCYTTMSHSLHPVWPWPWVGVSLCAFVGWQLDLESSGFYRAEETSKTASPFTCLMSSLLAWLNKPEADQASLSLSMYPLCMARLAFHIAWQVSAFLQGGQVS